MSIYYEAAVFMFFEVGVFTTSFANFTEKHLCWSLFWSHIYENETATQVFSCEICEIFKNTFFYRAPLSGCFCSLLIHILK